jgi:iron-sulfur cluster insertion protein|tara:strand:+ start:3753 stop:4079 length:327 start_codon:yes stop_codon:yes gene_type:complete
MLSITQAAKNYMKDILKDKHKNTHITLGVKTGGCSGFQYIWGLTVDKDYNNNVKWSKPIEDVLVIDPLAEMFIAGSEVDYIKELGGSYLSIKNPVASSSCGCGESFGV